jgi:riboflavin kinase / FMN adenylyltransferase
MTHIDKLDNAHLDTPSIVTIGVFDGVHVGHQQLLRQLVTEARATQRKSVVLTFFPHPDAVLRGITGRYYLTSPDYRAELMQELGVDMVITHPFDNDVRHIRATLFVEKLLTHLRMNALWVGADFAMGYQREGNADFLRVQGAQHGFAVQTIDLVTHAQDGAIISSTTIRDMLGQGRVETVRDWLGRAYQVTGRVVHGDQRGRLIGFPTANLAVWAEQALPANGVYAGWAEVNNKRYMAVTNIGTRPTFDGHDVRVEPHLLDFSDDIYDATLTLTFDKRLRSEQKFDGINTLKAQLQHDIAEGRAFLSQV